MLTLLALSFEVYALFVLLWAVWIDHTTGRLPDIHTLGAAVLILAAQALRGQFVDALAGAVVGFGLLKVTQIAYRRVRGRDGLGSGDAKLMLALGAMTGSPLGAVWTIGIGSGLALLCNLPCVIRNRMKVIPFGPYLLWAGLVCTVYLKYPDLWPLVWADLMKELFHA